MKLTLLMMALAIMAGLATTVAEEAPPPATMPPVAAPQGITLGEFVVKVATGLNLQTPSSGFTPENAAWALVQKGIRVRGDLTSPLTEGDSVGVLNGLGYKVRTTTPSRVMMRDRMQILLDTFIPPQQ